MAFCAEHLFFKTIKYFYVYKKDIKKSLKYFPQAFISSSTGKK